MTQDVLTQQAPVQAEGFVLRPLQQADLGPIDMHMSDQRVADMTSSIPHPMPPGASQAYLNRVMAQEGPETVWAMDAKAQGGADVMGLVTLNNIDRSQAEISYWVAPHFWGEGVASKAVNALTKANPLGSRTFFGSVFQDNPASAKVLTAAGFDYIGDAESYSVARKANVPTWTYLLQLA